MLQDKINLDESNWQHKDAREYVDVLMKTFGHPDDIGSYGVLWYDRGGFDTIVVKDESIPHAVPKPHRDFVYSTRRVAVEKDHMKYLAQASKSIIVDQLKGEVTARCGSLTANATTLGFVEDVVAGKIKSNYAGEYSKRIKGNETPEWWQDPVQETFRKKPLLMEKLRG